MADDELTREVDHHFAHNMKTRREALGMSQEDLAAKMRERDFAFSQAVVWKVEQNQRPVRIAEAVALGEILGERYLPHLLEPPKEHSHRMELMRANMRVAKAHDQIGEATRDYLEAVDYLALATADAANELDGYIPVRSLVLDQWAEVPPEYIALSKRLELEYAEKNSVDPPMSEVVRRWHAFIEESGWTYVQTRLEDFISSDEQFVKPEGAAVSDGEH
jgi:transcriptional regulator with XRE-family HTH domain